jgi:hypothetical protein
MHALKDQITIDKKEVLSIFNSYSSKNELF